MISLAEEECLHSFKTYLRITPAPCTQKLTKKETAQTKQEFFLFTFQLEAKTFCADMKESILLNFTLKQE